MLRVQQFIPGLMTLTLFQSHRGPFGVSEALTTNCFVVDGVFVVVVVVVVVCVLDSCPQ